MKDYNKIRKQLELVRDLAIKAIVETEKNVPDNRTICNIVCEKMSDLLDEVSSAVLREDASDC